MSANTATEPAHEERFDRIARMAQELFEAPIVSVTLRDRHRLGRVGRATLTDGRDDFFAELVMAENDTVVISDATLDPRTTFSPYVIGPPFIRFVAGHRLTASDGEPVGALFLLDTEPRGLAPSQLRALPDLADWAQRELHNDEELDRAGAVQQALLPRTAPDLAGYAFAGLNVPAQGGGVGGDFYDWYPVEGGVQLTLADVMGKGMGAALIAATTRAMLRGVSANVPDVGQGLGQAARLLMGDLAESSAFVTAFHARLDAASGRLQYADAGHGLSVLIRADGRSERLVSSALPLGIDADEHWPTTTLQIAPGDTLISYSDGLLELFEDPDKAIDELARFASRVPVESIRQVLLAYEAMHIVHDDLTAVMLRRHPDP